jgi:hypothetical protein
MIRESSPTPTPLPSSTPTPFYSVLATPAGAAQQTFEGHSIYQETPRFQVTFASTQWRAVETTLQHQQFTDCRLDLYAGFGEVRGPSYKSQVTLAGVTWNVGIAPVEGLISYYGVSKQLASYLFRVRYPPNASEDDVKRCQNAAEEIIATFREVKPNTDVR